MKEIFLKVDYRILEMQYIKDVNGKDRLFSLANRVLYCHLKTRFNFFKSRKERYFDTNKDISDALGIDEKTVSRGVKFLQEVGIVVVTKEKWRNLPKNVYTDVKEIIFNKSNNTEKNSQFSYVDNNQNQKHVVFDPYYDIDQDLDDIPF